MADCGDHTHQMIEYANLFDLRDMQLLRAEIDAIDRANNNADITLLDVCPTYTETSIVDVPFFYHCQYSTGTVEDLANGHNAFSVGDVVYVIHVPENGTTLERMYIVGHVDIRGTRVCPTEFLFISLSFTLNSTSYGFTTIFDTATGAKLDVDNFVNKDGGSPAKPASLPATSSSIAAWQGYNFGSVPVDGYTISGTVTWHVSYLYNYGFDYSGGYPCTRVVDNTEYSGSGANTECAEFSTGNGLYNYSEDVSCYDDGADPLIVVNEDFSEVTSASGIEKVTLSGTLCGPASSATSYEKNFLHQGTHNFLRFSVGADVVTVELKTLYEYNNEVNTSCSISSQVISAANFSGVESFTKNVYYDMSPLSLPNIVAENTWSLSASGALSTTPTYSGSTTSITPDESTCSHSIESPVFGDVISPIYVEESLYFKPWNMVDESYCFLKGRYYMYSILGATSIEAWKVTSSGSEFEVLQTTREVYPGIVSVKQSSTDNIKYSIRFISGAVVTYKETVLPTPPSYGISILDCLRNPDIGLSNGLNSVIEELLEFVVGQVIDYSDLESANEDILELLSGVYAGPSCTVLLKRS